MPALLELEANHATADRAFLEPPLEEQGMLLVDWDTLTKEELLVLARKGGLNVWETTFTVKKYHNAIDESETVGVEPDEIISKRHNLLMYGGASVMWEALIGNGTASAGQVLTFFSNAQAAIGVGDSSTSPAATQTNLQASSNKLRVGMSATYPIHVDGVISGSASIVFQGSFSSGQANFAWNEAALFNSTTDGVGRMLNRLAPGGGFGTKASGTWTLQIQVVLS